MNPVSDTTMGIASTWITRIGNIISCELGRGIYVR